MFKLLIEDDDGSKTVVPVIRDEITIGRQEGNTIRLTERNVSRRHGRILREDGRLFVEGISARYGLKVNGKKVSKRKEFCEGDVLLIGDYRLTLQAEKKASAGPPPKLKVPAFSAQATQITNINDIDDRPAERTEVVPALPAKLVVISSNFAGQEFPLKRKEMVIGRGDDCHIIIDHRSVSQKHAKVLREPSGTYKIVDLNSKNGIKVSGEDYRATHLKRGDVIELGHVKFRFVEAGENYVFTPQAASASGVSPAMAAPVASANKMNPMVLGGGAVVVVLLLLVIAFLVTKDKDPDPALDGGKVAAIEPTKGDSEANTAAVDSDDRIGAGMEKARGELGEGEVQRAISTLEGVRDFLDPSPEQQNQIGDMLSKARNELPFQRAYQAAVELVEEGKFEEALARLDSIPSHSLFIKLASENNVKTRALDGEVARAQKAFDADKFGDAKTLLEQVLGHERGYPPATRLLERIEDHERQVAAARLAAAEAKKASTPRETKREATPQIDPAQARELFTSAARKVAGGDPRGAVADCQQAVRGGHQACHRILGVAYGQLGDTNNACRHYKAYLRTKPANAAGIERQMENLGCPP